MNGEEGERHNQRKDGNVNGESSDQDQENEHQQAKTGREIDQQDGDDKEERKKHIEAISQREQKNACGYMQTDVWDEYQNTGSMHNNNTLQDDELVVMKPFKQEVEKLLSKKRLDQDHYTWFYSHVLSFVVGRGLWKAQCLTVNGSKMASISDEAFGLLLLDNSWDFWINQYNKMKKPNEEDMNNDDNDMPHQRRQHKGKDHGVKTKYTMEMIGASENQGWSEVGMQRFNQICREVEEDWNTKGDAFDKKYKQIKLIEHMGKKRQRSTRLDNWALIIPNPDVFSSDEEDS